ncbi:MAG: T9SS type A sorting domain-containing protein, partial [Chitinophagaceae bacterium]|nr:T9SS type A sorting domain-containing protein [Chitinophagaceae bacterium]
VITYSLPENGQLSIVLTDIAGRQVSVLFSGSKEKGRYTAPLNTGTLQPGLYFMQVRFNGKK